MFLTVPRHASGPVVAVAFPRAPRPGPFGNRTPVQGRRVRPPAVTPEPRARDQALPPLRPSPSPPLTPRTEFPQYTRELVQQALLRSPLADSPSSSPASAPCLEEFPSLDGDNSLEEATVYSGSLNSIESGSDSQAPLSTLSLIPPVPKAFPLPVLTPSSDPELWITETETTVHFELTGVPIISVAPSADTPEEATPSPNIPPHILPEEILPLPNIPLHTPLIPAVTPQHNMMPVIKPVPSSGEKGTTTITEFLDCMDLVFMVMTIPNQTNLARIKLLMLQSHLEGKANKWWFQQARADQKTTYEVGAAALRVWFPDTSVSEQARELGRAWSEFNVLKQGGSSPEKYAEKVEELHTILGDDFQHLLCMKFLDGIDDKGTRRTVDSLVEEPYTLTTVLAAWRKTTKSDNRTDIYPIQVEIENKMKYNDIEILQDPFEKMMKATEKKMAAMYLDSKTKILKQVKEYVNQARESGGGSNSGAVVLSGARPVAPNDRYQTGYNKGPWVPTCVVCGQQGHLSRDCTNAPLPAGEQAKLRERFLRPTVGGTGSYG